MEMKIGEAIREYAPYLQGKLLLLGENSEWLSVLESPLQGKLNSYELEELLEKVGLSDDEELHAELIRLEEGKKKPTPSLVRNGIDYQEKEIDWLVPNLFIKGSVHLLGGDPSVVTLGEASRLTLFHYREMASLEGFVFGEPKLLLDALIKDYCQEQGIPKYKALVEDTWISFNGLLYIWMRFDKNSELFSKYDDEWFLKSIKNLFKKQLSSHIS